MSTASRGSRISISRISVYITCIKKLKFASFVMFLAESLGGLTCSIEKSFHFPMLCSWEENAFVEIELVGLVHC